LYNNQGTGPAPSENKSVYAGIAINATVLCGSNVFKNPAVVIGRRQIVANRGERVAGDARQA
jgi:hypothetical protein